MKNTKNKTKFAISNETFVSSLQFSSCMGNAAWSKFSSLFFLEQGITASQLAAINSIQCITKLLGYPTFGMIADIFDNSKTLLLLSLMVSNMTLFLFYTPSTKEIIFSNFYLLLFVRGFRSYVNCIWSLIDAITLKLITDKKTYGKHRLYGSLAWGTSSLIGGKLIDIYGMQMMFIYGFCWSLFTFLLIYFLMPTNIPNYSQHKYRSLSVIDIDTATDNIEGEDSSSTDTDNDAQLQPQPRFDFCQVFKLLFSMRRDYQFMFTLLIMLIYWNAMFIIDRILFIQMDQEFGATKFMNGIATLCSTLPALPVFYYSSSLMRRYSLNKLYAFCHIILVLRLWAYLFCKDISMVWMIYCIESLHGINFGLGFAVCQVYLCQIGENYSMKNPSGINVRATIQSVKGTISLLSALSGSILWLPLYDHYGASTVYTYGAFTLIPSCIALWIHNSGERALFNVL